MLSDVHIGLLVNYSHSFERAVLRGIRSYVEERPNWQFTPVIERRGRLNWRGTGRPDGMIVSISKYSYAQAARSWGRPLVNIATLLPDLPYPRVAVDNMQVGDMAARHLLECGLRSFAFVGHPQHLYSVERETAFRAAIRETGCDISCFHALGSRPFAIHADKWYFDRRVEPWLLQLPKPVGIMAASDLWGMELSGICHEIGLRIPEDVAILGVNDDDLFCEYCRPPLSSVALPARRIGYEAAALLDRILSKGPSAEETLLLPPTHVRIRRSTEVLCIDDPLVVEAMRLIREHATRPMKVTDVVRELRVGRRTLERGFQKYFRRGIAEEICRVRVENCKRLLVETDFSLQLVARRSGFHDIRSMTGGFRRILGLTPKEFRRRHRIPQCGD